MQTVLRRTQIVIAIALAAFLAYTAVVATVLPQPMDTPELVGRGALLLVAVALVARWRIALRLAAAVLLVVALLLPIGVLNPFTAMDYFAQGTGAPSVAASLAWLIPVELLLVVSAWVLDLDPRRLVRRES